MYSTTKEKKRSPIQTGIINPRFLSLYDLIEAVQEEVRPKDDELVMDVLIDFFKSGRVKFLNSTPKPTQISIPRPVFCA